MSPPPVLPGRLWTTWSPDLVVIAALIVVAVAYARGFRTVRRATGSRSISGWRAGGFFGGLAAVAVALVSPLDPLAATLFSAHMVQHLILIVVAAPLLVVGRPLLVSWLGLPASLRHALRGPGHKRLARAVSRAATSPIPVWIAGVVALWAWHLPGPYTAALGNESLHVLEHTSFLGTALLFWALVLEPGPRRRLGYGPAIVYVFVMGLQSGALGAILTFASTVLYPAHIAGAHLWGLTGLEDQQLAGVTMWVPAGLVYSIVAAGLFVRWMGAIEKRVSSGRPENASAGAGR